MVIYESLFRKLSERRISQYRLLNEYRIPASTIQKLKKNEYVRSSTMDRFGEILECPPCELFRFRSEP